MSALEQGVRNWPTNWRNTGDNVDDVALGGDVITDGCNWWQWTNGAVGSARCVGLDWCTPILQFADFVKNNIKGEMRGK